METIFLDVSRDIVHQATSYTLIIVISIIFFWGNIKEKFDKIDHNIERITQGFQDIKKELDETKIEVSSLSSKFSIFFKMYQQENKK